MAQERTIELAKQGNPQAIKILMNQSLQPQGITVKVGLKDNCLMVVAESETLPEQSFLVNYIREGIKSLNPTSIQRVVLQAHASGDTKIKWRTDFDMSQKKPVKAATKATPHKPDASTILQKKPPNPVKQTSKNKPTSPVLKFIYTTLKILNYILIFAGLFVLAAALKIAGIIIAESILYKIQIIGDVLQGIQIVEALNVLVFAILGMGLGVAAILLPKKTGIYTSALLIILSLPVLVTLNDLIKYHDWINKIAEVETISYPEAQKMTNSFLQTRTGQSGMLGFYIHTAEYPVLPVKRAEMELINKEKMKVAVRFGNVAKITPEKMSLLFAISTWGLRFFYCLVAIMTVIYHFREGLKIVKLMPKA